MNYDRKSQDFRSLVVGVDVKVPITGGRSIKAINFDNAATTPPFQSVLDEILNFSPWYSSIHRGSGYKSMVSSNFYDNSRSIVSDFVKGDQNFDTVIYVKNTTEAINKLSNRLCINHKKCIILSTDMEHHSNDLPWRNKYTVDYISIDVQGRLSLKDLEAKLIKYRGYVKLVTITGVSNVTGYKNPIHQIAELSHRYGARILVDGAQLVPHVAVDMKPRNSKEHIDFLVFSAHKMYAPFGIGVLIGPKADFEYGAPDYPGGGTVKIVTHDYIRWEDPPGKDEAGTPNIMGVVALIAAIKTMTSLGMNNIEAHERSLTEYAFSRLSQIKDVCLYGDIVDFKDRISIIPLNLKDMRHEVVAKALSEEAGIAVRSGCFCAHPYIQKLLATDKNTIKYLIKNPNAPKPGMVRISFGIYNTFEEINMLLRAINKIITNKELMIKKYI
jgi:cysteine desulfurase / selenocysteine lyase